MFILLLVSVARFSWLDESADLYPFHQHLTFLAQIIVVLNVVFNFLGDGFPGLPTLESLVWKDIVTFVESMATDVTRFAS